MPEPRPRLVVVIGAPGSGKTTLAHAVAGALPCPAICRDEIKEGLIHSAGGPGADRDLNTRTNDAFFAVAELLIANGVTLVIEAAFQHRLWAAPLEALLGHAVVRVIHCRVDAERARARIAARSEAQAEHRAAHADAELLARLDRGELSLDAWQPLRLAVPTLVVDTSDGYAPTLDEIVAFARA